MKIQPQWVVKPGKQTNKLITLDVFIGSMDRGFGFGVLCAAARLVDNICVKNM